MAVRDGPDINLHQVASDIFCEFLEVSIHQILHVRGLYPEGIFERKKKYGVPISMCRHPELSKYISDAVNGIKCAVKKNEVQKVVVVILDSERTPVERFVFEIAPVQQNLKESLQSDDKYLLELEQSLRAFLLRINVSDSMLHKVPADSTFNILVHTKGGSAMETDDTHFLQEFPWMAADDSVCSLKDPKMIPLKATGAESILRMQLYVEETVNKSPDVT
ncbi:Mitotic spindle assembly checkpoint protein MAD2B [Holothuria leucospilota]|uniref:Mitotic spindle assembly checkpoint protein MAD2B n=1 Tax=Holothuria leucospilota TaxID=206669 RepID=A0A9Q1BBA3_HOLLE|nr:Mitotic spindle assembly checkpoint protein MAD2B [Holothuria leucospilota]